MKSFLICAVAVAVALVWSADLFAKCNAGDKAEVLWKGQWYAAKVIKAKGERCLVHYVGYDSSWNEWVGPERIKVTQEKKPDARTEAHYKIGEKVKVKWKNSWWTAQIMDAKGDAWRVHYEGYDNSWDEWVGADRIKKE